MNENIIKTILKNELAVINLIVSMLGAVDQTGLPSTNLVYFTIGT